MAEETLTQFRRQSMRCAEELGYDKEVVEKIKHAKTKNEITYILRTTRLKDSRR